MVSCRVVASLLGQMCVGHLTSPTAGVHNSCGTLQTEVYICQ